MSMVPHEVQLAIGRLFRIMSRPYQLGDDEDYMRCRAIIESYGVKNEYSPNYARDHNKGAQGQ